MKIIKGKFGDFWGCSNYPECDGIKKITEKPIEAKKSSVMPSKQEFHLTDEAIRSNALESAIKVTRKTSDIKIEGDPEYDYGKALYECAKQFEAYIRTGQAW